MVSKELCCSLILSIAILQLYAIVGTKWSSNKLGQMSLWYECNGNTCGETYRMPDTGNMYELNLVRGLVCVSFVLTLLALYITCTNKMPSFRLASHLLVLSSILTALALFVWMHNFNMIGNKNVKFGPPIYALGVGVLLSIPVAYY